MSYVLIIRSRPKYYIGTCLMFWFLRSRPRYYIGTCLMFWLYVPVQSITLEHVFCSGFTFLSKVLHWSLSYVLILRSSPNYYIGTCLMFWFYVPVHNITLEHVICSDFLRSRLKYYIGTCLLFWFYVPSQGIVLEHVLCSDFTFPFKLLLWNMSSVLIFTFKGRVESLFSFCKTTELDRTRAVRQGANR
jgi:hypothetical protein